MSLFLLVRRVHAISDWIEMIGDIQIIVRQADSFAPNLGSKRRNVAHLFANTHQKSAHHVTRCTPATDHIL